MRKVYHLPPTSPNEAPFLEFEAELLPRPESGEWVCTLCVRNKGAVDCVTPTIFVGLMSRSMANAIFVCDDLSRLRPAERIKFRLPEISPDTLYDKYRYPLSFHFCIHFCQHCGKSWVDTGKPYEVP